MCIREYLQNQRVPFDAFLHRPASTASRLARYVHVPGRRVAKGVLLKAGGGYILAVLPSTSRIDLGRFSAILAGEPVTLAEEAETTAIFSDCEPGAVPPFGSLYGLPTYVEAGLAGGGVEIVCVGNQRHEGFRFSYEDFDRLVGPTVASFAQDSARPDGSAARRIAG